MWPRQFDIDVEDDGTLLVLTLRGELDLGSVDRVRETVLERGEGRRALVMDLRALEFMDSSGLSLMLELQTRSDGPFVAFTEPPPRVGRVLDITGARSSFNWVTTPQDALTRCGG
jgi:anti-anti-sigma factor